MSDPNIVVLDRRACEELLARHNVGRIGFTFRDRVDIEPLHYVYSDGWLYGRTQEGTKLRTLARHPWVAFEVDEVESLWSWRSVVVKGRMEFPDPSQFPSEQEKYNLAVTAFRQLVPNAFAEGDPTPERNIVWAIPLHTVEGRASRGAVL